MTADWRPTANRAALELRARMLARTRKFFAKRGVLEVQTPILSAAGSSDPQIDSLHTRIAGRPQAWYLNTSPEFAMKRLLAAGSGDIYQLSKVFRDGEIGRWHEPEFSLLEWYRVGFDDHALMDEVAELLATLLPASPAGAPERLSYREALQRHAGVDSHSATDEDLAQAARRAGIDCPSELDRDARLDLLMSLVVGPKLGRGRITFVCDYPASQAALARLKPGQPAAAARFELYREGIELANGFHELTDADEQRARFERDLELRRQRGQPTPPMDERLLAALAAGMPDCAGVALGFDRLVAVALGADRLAPALSFVLDNA
ncbi:MAG: EF-P lysine aminoacylase GenX [Proteobacteria bacterium]|nr:EF-P lysine aminoacylase GenX [Pseudomonadota bacterium]